MKSDLKYKVINVILLACCIIVFAIPINAANMSNNTLNANILIDVDSIFLEGKIKGASDVDAFFQIFKPGKDTANLTDTNAMDILIYQEQITLGKDGNFNLNFQYNSGDIGICKIKVGVSGFDNILEQTFDTTNVANIVKDIDNINKVLKGTDVAVLKTAIETMDSKYSFNATIYDSVKNVHSDYLYGKLLTFTDVKNLNELKENLNSVGLLVLVNKANTISELSSIIDTYKTNLGINNLSAYTTFHKLIDDNSKQRIIEHLLNIEFENNMGNVKKWEMSFQKEYEKKVILTAIENANGWENEKEILEANKKVLNLDFELCNSLKTPQEVYRKMIGTKTAELSGISPIFTALVDEEKLREQSGSGGGSGGSSGGGGGSGGGSGSYPTITNGNNRPPIKPNTADENVFTDLDSVLWAKDSIVKLHKLGIVDGKGNKEFDPEGLVTRGEFSKMLVLALHLADVSANSNFGDVPASDWSYKYVSSLANKGIIYGMNSEYFGKDSYITREDMAVIVYRAFNYLSGENSDNKLYINFDDKDEIADYAVSAVAFMEKENMILGTSDNIFSPKQNASRAQSAVILDRVINFINR